GGGGGGGVGVAVVVRGAGGGGRPTGPEVCSLPRAARLGRDRRLHALAPLPRARPVAAAGGARVRARRPHAGRPAHALAEPCSVAPAPEAPLRLPDLAGRRPRLAAFRAASRAPRRPPGAPGRDLLDLDAAG